MLLSRRSLFSQLKDNILENINNSIKKIPIKLDSSETKEINRNDWVLLGKIKDFPPNSITFVNENKYVVFSNFYGFFVINKDSYDKGQKSPRYLIKLEHIKGNILLNYNNFCNEDELLSIMTGNFIKEEEE